MGTKKPYVFISYSSKNTVEAEKIRNLLTRNGIQNWMAPHNIPVGAKYAHVIDEAIENCECVLLLLTKEAQESDHVDREIERAVSYQKEIIPMRLDSSTLNSGFRYYIGNCQIIDISVIDEENKETKAIIQRLEQKCWEELDAFLSFMQKAYHQWQNTQKTYIVDPERMLLLQNIYGQIIELLEEEGCEQDDYTIAITPCPLRSGDVSISFVCDEIIIHNIKLFCKIVQHLRNFEIYPLDSNKLEFAGIFPKVARIINTEE